MAKSKEFEVEYNTEKLRRTKIRKELRKVNKGSRTTCPNCKRDVGYYVGYVINPYFQDMCGDNRLERMCRDCYDSAVGDI